jgi:LuxR family transcriptional regulator, maltose regulon positive regulatory protein
MTRADDEQRSGQDAEADHPAKFAMPVASQVVERARLHERLTAGLDTGTTLVAATAGWGKTLLAGSWVAAGSGGRPAAWVSLDRADDDEGSFWRSVATALLPVADNAASAGLRRVAEAAPGALDLPSELAEAVRQLHRPVVVVLDNLHEVRSAQVHAGLLRFVERPLPALSLLATTRHDPPWPLPRLRLAGLLSEVRADDLAFRPDEVAGLFGQLQVQLSAGQLERLLARTEGWAAGLRLAALDLRGRDDVEAAVDTFSGDDHSVTGYLLSEVLDRQPAELVAFLEQISVVDLISPGLADALTGRHDGEAMLAELAAAHLFVQAVGRPGRWYRLHRLIVDLLRARPMPQRRRRDLNRRAAEWFRDHDMPLDAVCSALRGQLWPLAADLVATHLAPLILHGSARELDLLLDEVPRAVLLDRPELATGLAGARLVQGVATDVDALIDAARTGVAHLPARRADRVDVIIDMLAGARARLIGGDFDAAVAAFARVPRRQDALARLGLSEPDVITVMVRGNLGTAELWRGELAKSAEHLLAATDPGPAAPTLPHLNTAAHLALLLCERGELDTAEARAREAAATAARLGWTRTGQAVGAYLTMARVLLDRDELDEIDGWLSRVAEVEAVAPEPHVQLAEALVLAARREAVGDRERALTGLHRTAAQLAPWSPPRALAERWAVAEAALLARSGDRRQARTRLDALGAPRTAAGAIGAARVQLLLGEAPLTPLPDAAGATLRLRVDANLVRALTALAAGDEEASLTCLEDALLPAASIALRRPFLAENPELRDLLQLRVERGTAAPAFAVDLLQRMSGAPVDELAARRALVDPLTEREQTILRYLASTLSNAEIANELYVSINTVKTHQQTVYRKLGAGGRRDAVRRARALRLL